MLKLNYKAQQCYLSIKISERNLFKSHTFELNFLLTRNSDLVLTTACLQIGTDNATQNMLEWYPAAVTSVRPMI